MSLDPGPALSDDLVAAFTSAAGQLYASEDLAETLQRVTASAKHVVDGCDVASVSLIDPDRRIHTEAPTDPAAEAADKIQYSVGQGPCLDAAAHEQIVYTADTVLDERWPRFMPRVAEELGIRSVISCRLALESARHRTLGSLNLYSREVGAYDADDRMLALLLASHVAVVIDASQQQSNLRRAIESRDVIGQAKGILMAQTGIDADEAFEQLKSASQRLNVKLATVAHNVARSTSSDRSKSGARDGASRG